MSALFMTELVVSDFAAALHWYQAALALDVQLTDEANGFALLAGAGGGRLALKTGTPATGGVKLHFLVADLDADLSRLATLGVAPDGPLKTSPEGYRRAILRDPDGYTVVLFEWSVRSGTA